MKHNIRLAIVCGFIIACSNNKAAQDQPVEETGKQTELVSNTESQQPTGDGITGYWKLKIEAYDDNGNKVLDEAERKKAIQNRYTFRFKADGSCSIQESFKGRYEVKTEGSNKMLSVYRNRVVGEEDTDPPPDVYRIVSMSNNEMVLLEKIGDLVFWVFERAG